MVDVFLYLIIYSFLGWCCECVYCSFGEGQWINRGFLTGPFCPIYGFGAIATLGFLQYLPQSTICVFVGGVIITSTLEYITSWVMEKMFNTRWWDYSKRRFNLSGRVCLLNSTLFGLLCLFLVFDLHPQISKVSLIFSLDFKYGFLFAFVLYFIADFTLAVKSVLDINIRLQGLMDIREKIIDTYTDFDFDLNIAEIDEKFKTLNIKGELTEKFNKSQKEIGFFERRIMKSFPDMSNKSYPESLETIKQNLKKKIEK